MLVLAMEFSRGAPPPARVGQPMPNDDETDGRERPDAKPPASRKKRRLSLPQNGTARSDDHASPGSGPGRAAPRGERAGSAAAGLFVIAE